MFITEEVEAEMRAAGYSFDPPTYYHTEHLSDWLDIQLGETLEEALSRYSRSRQR
jgi:hypothetical protein